MAVTTDILKTWRRPGAVFRPRLAAATEPGALAVLMGACFLIFVSQWPGLSRQAHLARIAAEEAGTPPDQVPGLQALIGINLFVLMFMAPLIFYAIAWLSGVVLRAVGSPVAPLAARMALFWALLAAPLMLFQGLVAGFVGPGPALTAVGVLILLAFLLALAAAVAGGADMTAFLAALRLTLTSPRAGLRAVLSRDLPPGTGLMGLALIAVLSSLALHAMGGLSPAPETAVALAGPEEALFSVLLGTPFTTALVQFVLFIVMAVLALVIGRWRGGTGTADQAFLAMAWLEAVMFSVQIALLLVMAVLLLIVPPLFVLVGALSGPVLVGMFFWYLSSFIAELHGFRSVPRVLLAVILVLILASFVLSPILVALIGPEALHV